MMIQELDRDVNLSLTAEMMMNFKENM